MTKKSEIKGARDEKAARLSARIVSLRRSPRLGDSENSGWPRDGGCRAARTCDPDGGGRLQPRIDRRVGRKTLIKVSSDKIHLSLEDRSVARKLRRLTWTDIINAIQGNMGSTEIIA